MRPNNELKRPQVDSLLADALREVEITRQDVFLPVGDVPLQYAACYGFSETVGRLLEIAPEAGRVADLKGQNSFALGCNKWACTRS